MLISVRIVSHQVPLSLRLLKSNGIEPYTLKKRHKGGLEKCDEQGLNASNRLKLGKQPWTCFSCPNYPRLQPAQSGLTWLGRWDLRIYRKAEVGWIGCCDGDEAAAWRPSPFMISSWMGGRLANFSSDLCGEAVSVCSAVRGGTYGWYFLQCTANWIIPTRGRHCYSMGLRP